MNLKKRQDLEMIATSLNSLYLPYMHPDFPFSPYVFLPTRVFPYFLYLYRESLFQLTISLWKDFSSIKIGNENSDRDISECASVNVCTPTLLHETNKVADRPAHRRVITSPLL